MYGLGICILKQVLLGVPRLGRCSARDRQLVREQWEMVSALYPKILEGRDHL